MTTVKMMLKLTTKLSTDNDDVAIAMAAALLVFFAGWTALTWRPVFVTYHSKYSIFFRHYQQHGLLRSRFIPTFNFEMTDRPRRGTSAVLSCSSDP